MWLFGIARHVLARSARRGRVESAARERIGLDPLVLRPHQHRADRGADRGRGRRDRRALAGRPPADQASALRARVLDEREYEDIAGRPRVLGGGRAPAGQPRARAPAPAVGRGRGMTRRGPAGARRAVAVARSRARRGRLRPGAGPRLGVTILPELRDDLARGGRAARAARRARLRAPAPASPPGRGGVAGALLGVTAGALAATGRDRDRRPGRAAATSTAIPARGVGVPVRRRPRGCCRCGWPIRTAGRRGACASRQTSRGMTCLQIGRVGRRPARRASARTGASMRSRRPRRRPAWRRACRPTGPGRFYTAVDRTAFGWRCVLRVADAAVERGEQPRGRPCSARRTSPRHVAYGLLGPEAATRHVRGRQLAERPRPTAPTCSCASAGKRDAVMAMGGGPAVQPAVRPR